MNTNNVMNAIAALDLEPVKTKLMHVASGEGWSRSKANALDVEYRRFLYLMVAFPEEQTAPTVDVDTFWHYHILDTIKYAADCEKTFGFFLHHYPHLGMEGEHDVGAQLRGGERMRELYEQTFGQAYIRAEAYGEAPGAQAAFCQKVTGAQAAFCQKVTGAQAAFCQNVTGAQPAFCQKVTGAQAAFCQKVTGAQPAFCQKVTGAQPAFCQKVTGAQAAFCQKVTGAQAAFCQKVTGAQAAFCQKVTGAQPAFCQKVTGAQAANDPAAFRSGDLQTPVRPAAPIRPAVSSALAA